jgi:hypothetical protein
MSIEPSYDNLEAEPKEPLQIVFVPESESDLNVNVNLTNILNTIIKSHYNDLSDIIIKQIKNLSVKMLELIEPILKEDEELLITFKFSKSHLDIEKR